MNSKSSPMLRPVAVKHPNRRRQSRMVGVLLSATFLSSQAAAEDVLTTFTLESPQNSVGTWSLSAGILSGSALANPSTLSTGSNTYAFTTQYFTPTVGGTYEFGQSEAPLDTVMLLYDGSFDPTDPGANALAGNDDGVHPSIVDIESCGSPSFCPSLSYGLTTGTDYHVVVSHYSPSAISAFTLPQSFYVVGPASVGVGGEPPEGGGTPDIDADGYTVSDLNEEEVTSHFDGGTLVVDIDGEVGDDFVIEATGGTIDTDGRDVTFSGRFSGTGTLIKSGGGTLVLAGVNSFAGDTRITGGVLSVASGSNLGSGSVTLDGGTLATTASFGTTRTVAIGSGGGGLRVAGGTTLSLGGGVAGGGALNVSGGGTVEIGSGTTVQVDSVSLAGGRFILDGISETGSIVVARDASFGGSGAHSGDVTLSGTLSPGNSPGTMRVGGDFDVTSTGVLSVEIDGRVYSGAGGAGSYDRLILTGDNAVFTADGTLAPVLRNISGAATNAFTPVVGDSFRIVTTTNDDGIAGAFATVSQPSDGLAPGTRFAAIYGDAFIDLVVAPSSFGDFAEELDNGNATAMGRALDRMIGRTDAASFVEGFYRLPSEGLGVALEQASGEIHAFALDAVSDRLHHSLNSLGDAAADEGFWTDASGYWADKGATEAAAGYESRTGHVWVGRALGGGNGIAVGYSNVSVDTGNGAKADGETAMLAFYRTWAQDGLDFDASVGVAYSWLDTSREVRLSSWTAHNSASADVLSAFASLGAGHEHALGADLQGRAWGRITAAAFDSRGYDEDGADVTALDVDGEASRSALLSAGYQIGGPLEHGTWLVGAGLQQGTGRLSRNVGQYGQEWTVSTADNALGAFASAGISLQSTETSSLSIHMRRTVAEGYDNASLGVSYSLTW